MLKWNRDKKFTVTENCTIYSRLANSKGQGGETIKYVVGNIDKIAPNEFTPVVSKMRYNQIVLLCNVSDNLSGPGKYKYYLNGMPVYTGTENTYTINGLTEKTTYTLYVEVWDKAGNYRKSKEITVTTPDKSLANVVSTGQYVNYNAGGTNKWRVYSIDNDRVTLISDYLNTIARINGATDWKLDFYWTGWYFDGYNYYLVSTGIGGAINALNEMSRRHYMNNLAESARSVNVNDIESLRKLGLLGCSYDNNLGTTSAGRYHNWSNIYFIDPLSVDVAYTDTGHHDVTDRRGYVTYVCLHCGEVGKIAVGTTWYAESNHPIRYGGSAFVRPIVTLKPDVYANGGSGTASDPWQLGI